MSRKGRRSFALKVRMRTVLVTGGARRIGRAICRALASRGWRVIVHARREDDSDARTLATALKGGFLFGDLEEAEAADRLFDQVRKYEPECCALVNNAALFSVAPELPPSEAARLKQVNTYVPQRLTDRLAEYLREKRVTREGSSVLGAVVDVLDTRVLRLQGGTSSPYAESKRLLFESIKARAISFADCLRINGVAPGPVLKPTESCNREKGGRILLPFRPTPEDVAETVSFLLEANGITGQVIAVDSGQSII